MPNWSQLSGGLDRIVLVGLTWLASKGYITSADVANYAALIVGIAGTIYAFYVNRNGNLLKQAASVKVDGQKTTVVAPDALAKSLPQSNIVSADDNKVVSK